MKYYIYYLAGFLVFFLSLPIYNYTVDWYGVFQRPDEKGKVYTKNPGNGMNMANFPYLRMNNAIKYMEENDGVGVLMGSSRLGKMSDGYATKILGFNFVKANYPLAMLPEHVHNLKVLLDRGLRPSAVIIGIDDFSIKENIVHESFNRRVYPLGFREYYDFWKEQLFRKPDINELKLSVVGDYSAVEAIPPPTSKDPWITPDGFLTDKHRNRLMSASANRELDVNSKVNIKEAISSIKEIKRLSLEHNISLIFYYTPRWATTYLYRDHELLHRFKRELAKYTEYFDFSGLVSETMEHSLWYRDASHYTTALNDIIIDKISSGIVDNSKDSLFGRLVTGKNIDRHLGELKSNLQSNIHEWIRQKPDADVHPNLYPWLFDKYKERNTDIWSVFSFRESDWNFSEGDDNKARWSKKKKVSLNIPIMQHTKLIRLYIEGIPDTYLSGKRKSKRLIIKVNNRNYGSALLGTGKGPDRKKMITILGPFDKETKIEFMLKELYKKPSSGKGSTPKSVGFLLYNEATIVGY